MNRNTTILKQHKIKRHQIICFAVILLAVLTCSGCTFRGASQSTKPSSEAQNNSQNQQDEPEDEPIDGGVTDKSDLNAPKFIESKDIDDFYARFGLDGEWSKGNRNVFYSFELKTDNTGTLNAYEYTTGISAPANEELLDALQEIIDAQNLVAWNGEYRITAGLPPEFGPCDLNVSYASGERLSFTHNNEPEAEWAQEIYLAFAKWFAGQGIDTLLPPETVMGSVRNVMIEFEDPDDGTWCDYGLVEDPDADGNYTIMRSVGEDMEEIPLTDMQAFLDSVNAVADKYDLRKYDESSVLYGYAQTEDDRNDPFLASLQLTFWYDNDEQLFIYTSDPDGIDELRPLVKELMACFDACFAQ